MVRFVQTRATAVRRVRESGRHPSTKTLQARGPVSRPRTRGFVLTIFCYLSQERLDQTAGVELPSLVVLVSPKTDSCRTVVGAAHRRRVRGGDTRNQIVLFRGRA